MTDTSKRKIVDLMKFIDSISSRVEEYDDKLVNRFISKIVLKDKVFEFTFKSGFTMELKRG